MSKVISIVIAVAVLFALCSCANAVSLPVANYSFEIDAPGAPDESNVGAGWWTTNTNRSYRVGPVGPAGTWAQDGLWAAKLDANGAAFETLNALRQVATGEVYTVRWWAKNYTGSAGELHNLYAVWGYNSTVRYFSGSPQPPITNVGTATAAAANTWQEYSATFTVPEEQNGTWLGLLFWSSYTGRDQMIDNIRVDYEPVSVPEPTGVLALASAIAGLAGLAIRRRR